MDAGGGAVGGAEVTAWPRTPAGVAWEGRGLTARQAAADGTALIRASAGHFAVTAEMLDKRLESDPQVVVVRDGERTELTLVLREKRAK
jgi:hypothetical protein